MEPGVSSGEEEAGMKVGETADSHLHPLNRAGRWKKGQTCFLGPGRQGQGQAKRQKAAVQTDVVSSPSGLVSAVKHTCGRLGQRTV